MKKIISIVSILTISLLALTACGKEKQSESAYDINEVLNSINSKISVAEAGNLDDEYLSIMIGINKEDIKSYAGKITQNSSACADQIIVIEAADGKIDSIKQKLEEYKDSIIKSHELYPSIALDKAKEGRIVTKGNIVVLVIGGDESKSVSDAYKDVDSAIDEAFK